MLRSGGTGFATLPWSARVHFELHDLVRLTPFEIERAFKEADFSSIEVKACGSTSAVLANKMLICLVDSVSSKRPAALLFLLLSNNDSAPCSRFCFDSCWDFKLVRSTRSYHHRKKSDESVVPNM